MRALTIIAPLMVVTLTTIFFEPRYGKEVELVSIGVRGAGDTGFITTLTPGLAFRKKAWRVTLDVGGSGALLSQREFGRQDIGGPFQFIGHGGVSVHLPGNLVAGYRFHHMSDATIYGNNRGVDLHMLELSYSFEK